MHAGQPERRRTAARRPAGMVRGERWSVNGRERGSLGLVPEDGAGHVRP
jgi:hypothetical protein